MKTGDVLLRPIITEKSMHQVSKQNKFEFEIAHFATKDDVRKAVSLFYGVEVISVSTHKIKGRSKRTGSKRQVIMNRATKKALVELKEGQKIVIFEGIS